MKGTAKIIIIAILSIAITILITNHFNNKKLKENVAVFEHNYSLLLDRNGILESTNNNLGKKNSDLSEMVKATNLALDNAKKEIENTRTNLARSDYKKEMEKFSKIAKDESGWVLSHGGITSNFEKNKDELGIKKQYFEDEGIRLLGSNKAKTTIYGLLSQKTNNSISKYFEISNIVGVGIMERQVKGAVASDEDEMKMVYFFGEGVAIGGKVMLKSIEGELFYKIMETDGKI